MRKGISMARNVKVIDSSGYSGGGFLKPEIEVMEIDGRGPYSPYGRRRWRGGEPLVLILILAIVAIWMYQKSGGEVFGRQIGGWISATRNVPPVEIETAPVAPPLAPVEEAPVVTVNRRTALTAEQQSDILGNSRVEAESLNLRDQPGLERRVIAVLPRHWEVAILRQSHVTPNGDVWVEVMAETDDGWRKGWVIWRYLESCNC